MQKNAKTFGMTLDEFWNGNPDLFYLYKEVYEDNIQLEQTRENIFAWQQGVYTLQAFRQGLNEALSKNRHEIFPKEPYKQKEENKEPDTDFEKNFFDIMMAKANIINQKFKK